jgi:hypothetical protein
MLPSISTRGSLFCPSLLRSGYLMSKPARGRPWWWCKKSYVRRGVVFIHSDIYSFCLQRTFTFVACSGYSISARSNIFLGFLYNVLATSNKSFCVVPKDQRRSFLPFATCGIDVSAVQPKLFVHFVNAGYLQSVYGSWKIDCGIFTVEMH